MNKNDIKAIDKTTVHRICSGQVVLNLAVAVKELVENSIDAGATVVEIKLKEYGSESIEVSDNGTGVHPDNFSGLTLKHHTSKLKDFSDLVGVETFGFRGEALSSLCALSEVSILTKHSSQDCATQLFFDSNGHIRSSLKYARQVGTTITLSKIFYSLPVRQKEFHKNIKREFNKMIQLLYAYCLVSTNTKITCINHTKKSRTTVVATHGCPTLKENISCVFGSKQLNNILELKTFIPSQEILNELKFKIEECEIFNINGLISSCSHGSGRSTTDRQFYYINSRPCEPSKIIKTVNEVYHQYNQNQYPFVYMNITVNKDSVDVNVTPDKRQIFLDREKLLVAIIKSSLHKIYENIPSTYTMNNIPKNIEVHKNNDGKPNLSLLNQWRHKNDLKRNSDDDINIQPKKAKIDNSQPNLKSFLFKNPIDKPNIEHTILELEIGSDENITCFKKEDFNKDKSVSEIKNKEIFDIQKSQNESLNDTTNEIGTNLEVEYNEMDDIQNVQTDILRETLNDTEDIIEAQDEENIEKEHKIDLNQTEKIEYDSYTERGKKYINIHVDMAKLKLNSTKTQKTNLPSIKFRAVIDPTKNDQAENELKKEIKKDMFSKMEIIGQFNLGFIIVKLNSDLFIVDQHASDEKYNFETLQKNTIISNQKLVIPELLDLTAANESILFDNIEIFNKNGFVFKIDENAPPTKRVFLTGKPMSKNWVFGKEDIDELIFMLQDSPNTECRPSRVRAMFASRACRKSVMIGTALNKNEMKKLINQMGNIENPWNCPHGRPTMRHLVNLDLLD